MPTSPGAPSIMHGHTQIQFLLLPPFKLPEALSHCRRGRPQETQLGLWVASTSLVTLAIFLLPCTLVSLGEGVWAAWSWSLGGVGVVCLSQG